MKHGFKFGSKTASWERLEGVFTELRHARNRKRRVWATFSGHEPTKEELALKWPKDYPTVRYRKLQDEAEYVSFAGHVFHLVIKVIEKRGPDGWRFWREVLKQYQRTDDIEMSNDEEKAKWHELLRDAAYEYQDDE